MAPLKTPELFAYLASILNQFHDKTPTLKSGASDNGFHRP
jgi:hypothetical protein